MCVDKDLADLTDFADLVSESRVMEQEWHIVLIACLTGKNDRYPTSSETEESLKIMVQTVQNGGDLSKYLAFNNQGDLLRFA
jgi:hypothetical protein